MITVEEFFDLNNVSFSDLFKDLSYPWEALSNMQSYLDSKINTENVVVGEGTVIEKDAVIKGKAIIGKNCLIGNAVLMRDNCILGDNVQIGHGVELKNVIILNNSSIAHLNYVGDSIVGNNVNISAGAIVANLRLDRQEILVNIQGEKINTGLGKFGAIIGDGCAVGVNSVLNPGTILGKNCVVYPLTSVRGFHQANEIIK
ncbi:MAG TPA: DapH/DapD/GlmU-related protein [Patescibacteria group bacterium]|jgi:NDP-sugar pyrophosphorylase family protein|nr:DapH/DapD/GlmU-related protein [Patescibacteria group bacterium]